MVETTETTETTETNETTEATENSTTTEETTDNTTENNETEVSNNEDNEDTGNHEDTTETKDELTIESYEVPEYINDDLKQFALENKLDNKQFNNVISKFENYLQKTNQKQMEMASEEGRKHVESWGEEAKTNVMLAKQALEITDPTGKLKELLDITGAGNNPVVLDYFKDLGKSLAEGGFIKAKPATKTKKSLADKLYG